MTHFTLSAHLCLCAIAVALLNMTTAAADTASDRAAIGGVVKVSEGDKAMQAAFAKARASLPDFLAKAKNPKAGTANYALKIDLGSKQQEFIWVEGFEQTAKGFTGKLGNTPQIVTGYYYEGQRVDFSRQDIVDWVYIDREAGKMHGNFTLCAILSNEPKEEAAALQEQFGLSCDQ